MKILVSSTHVYPALVSVGSGRHPKAFPSGSGFLVHDLMVRGLAELGHEVFYLLRNGANGSPPPGCHIVNELVDDADILHTISDRDFDISSSWASRRRPWVTTCHLDPKARDQQRLPSTRNWIFVSRALANLYGSDRYVWNGIDPEEYMFAEEKSDYFLFMSTMDWEMKKGLDICLHLARKMGFKLVVAGTGKDYESIWFVENLCNSVGAEYVGDVRGKEKADLLAKAKGFLFPTRLDEAFGLGMSEALMSGTPVICSDRGACPELITNDVGFVCSTEEEYISAINNVERIVPAHCRATALSKFHYMTMAENYVTEYRREIEFNNSANGHFIQN